jgi:mRNA export factor
MYDLNTGGEAQQIAAHDAPIKCCEFIDVHGPMLVTASWDKTLKVG